MKSPLLYIPKRLSVDVRETVGYSPWFSACYLTSVLLQTPVFKPYSQLLFQINTTEIQDIDLSRFVPQEVDHEGITVAATDRFTSRKKTQPKVTDDGKKNESPSSLANPLFKEKHYSTVWELLMHK